MFCEALNKIVRKKSKLVCKLLVSMELDGSCLILRFVPSSVLLCGLLGERRNGEDTTAKPMVVYVSRTFCMKHLW